MSDIPSELKYAKTHEWAVLNEDDLVTVGITDYAQQSLGDIVFVELPEVGRHIAVGKEFGVIESVKAASDLYSPLNGEVVAVNQALVSNPALVNSDPYHAGWLIKIQPNDMKAWADLLDPQEYAKQIDSDQPE